MIKSKFLTTAAALAFVGFWPLGVPAQTATDPHHPPGATGVQAPSPMPPGMKGGMGNDKEMADSPMMKMMAMMKAMHSGDAAGMAMIDHIEGRIAYVRAELRITDAQASAWDAFAAALRTNAKNLAAVREPMMGQMAMGQPGMAAGEPKAAMQAQMQPQTLARRLEAQERWQAARLEGTRAIRSAFTKLNDVLSADQRKAADELLPPNLGLAMPMMMKM
jgi:hypothetical protein